MTNTSFKRITIVTGHFGSGKSEFAINYALKLKEIYKDVVIIDFDIVNPYFRTKDAEQMLVENGIKIITPKFANTNIENPSLPAEIISVFEDKECYAVFDVGGDDNGAVPLGRYSKYFDIEKYEMFFVLNERRPLTSTVSDSIKMLKDIENSSRLKVTGIVNNTHLKEFTTLENITAGQVLAENVAESTELTVKYISGKPDILNKLTQAEYNYKAEKFPIDLYLKNIL